MIDRSDAPTPDTHRFVAVAEVIEVMAKTLGVANKIDIYFEPGVLKLRWIPDQPGASSTRVWVDHSDTCDAFQIWLNLPHLPQMKQRLGFEREYCVTSTAKRALMLLLEVIAYDNNWERFQGID